MRITTPAIIRIYAFIQHSNGDSIFTVKMLSDAITQNHLPPVCFVTTQHLKHMKIGGRDARYSFGKAQDLGLFIVFCDRVNMYICLFFAL